MKHLFLNKHLSLLAKEKGFDNPCLAIYTPEGNFQHLLHIDGNDKFFSFNNSGCISETCTAPLYQQIIDWFEIEHQIYIYTFKYIGRWNWKIDTEIIIGLFNKGEGFDNKYEALNKAIEEAFKLIN